jgi:hypothetical protein
VNHWDSRCRDTVWPRVSCLAPFIVLLDFVREVDSQSLAVHIGVLLGDSLPGLLLGCFDLVLVSLLDTVEQGTVAFLSASTGVVKVGVVA